MQLAALLLEEGVALVAVRAALSVRLGICRGVGRIKGVRAAVSKQQDDQLSTSAGTAEALVCQQEVP